MRRARWIVPLILLLPLVAPAPELLTIEGRAYDVRDDAPRAAFSTTLSPVDDGISYATARLIPNDAPPTPGPPAIEWSYGPLYYATPGAAPESGGSAGTPAPPPATGAPPTVPLPPTEPTPTPAPPPVQPPADEPQDGSPGDPETPPAIGCTGLCFAIELGLL